MLKLLLIALCINCSLAQQAQRSPFASQTMYYFYSYSDQSHFKDWCDRMGLKEGGSFLILGRDTVRFTQCNDSLKVIRNTPDAQYLGRGIEDVMIIANGKVYIKFKEFIKQ